MSMTTLAEAKLKYDRVLTSEELGYKPSLDDVYLAAGPLDIMVEREDGSGPAPLLHTLAVDMPKRLTLVRLVHFEDQSQEAEERCLDLAVPG